MALLAAAAILDALDGRVARVLNATSRMGEEIDSLADAVNFGVAPAFIVRNAVVAQPRRLDRGAPVHRVHRAAPGLLQLGAGRGSAGLHQGLFRRDAGAGRRYRRDRSAGREDAVARAVVVDADRRNRRDHLDGGVAAGGQPDPDAQDPHLQRFLQNMMAPLLALFAIVAAAAFVFPTC